MVLFPNRCCGCSGCVDNPIAQVVVDFEPGSGSGEILPEITSNWGNGGLLETRAYSTECGGEPVTYVLDVPCCTAATQQTLCVSQTAQTSGDFGDRTGCATQSDRFEYDPVEGVGFPRSNATGELCPCIWSEYATLSVSLDLQVETAKIPELNWVGPPALFATEGVLGREVVGLYGDAGIAPSVPTSRHTVLRVARAKHRKPPTALIPRTATGSGAVLEPVYESFADRFGQPYWIIKSIVVVDGGIGYPGGSAPCSIDGEFSQAVNIGLTVNGSGTITAAGLSSLTAYAVGLSEYEVVRTRSGPPTVTASAPPTVTGAALTASLSHTGSGASQYWSVDSVTATTIGTGWQPGDAITFLCPDGVTEIAAEAEPVIGHVEPVITASVSGGTGATLSVTLAQIEESFGGLDVTPGYWAVSAVSVSGTTSGYTDQTLVTFTTTATATVNAVARINCVRAEPTVTAEVIGSGSGASVTVNLTQDGNYWYVDSVTIVDGGTGYTDGDYLIFSVGSGDVVGVNAEAVVYVSDGVIVTVDVYLYGQYWHPTDEIASVSVYNGGAYYAVGVSGFTVSEPGKYYQQDYEITETPVAKPECKGYGEWEVLLDEETGPAVGEHYGNQMVIYGATAADWALTRRCEFGTMTVTVQ